MDARTNEEKIIINNIKRKVFELEKDNFKRKDLSTPQMIKKIKKIIEEEVKC